MRFRTGARVGRRRDLGIAVRSAAALSGSRCTACVISANGGKPFVV
jgi:hypothetical protein